MEEQKSFLASVPILAYHQVVSDDSLTEHSAYVMPLSRFERQMQFLYDFGYRCITLDEFLRSWKSGLHHREKVFILTFDDGYENFSTTAFPILSHYGFTATVFLVANCIGKVNHWDENANAPLLTWDQIKELREAGISFGSHTSSHPHLPSLSNEQASRELVGSKELLESFLGQEVSFLAYPYGESTSEVQHIAAQTGYVAACGVITGNSGLHNLWRRPCESKDGLLLFRFKLTPWYYHFLRLLRWVREDIGIGRHLRSVKYQWLTRNKKSL